MNGLLIALTVFLAVGLLAALALVVQHRREAFIRNYELPRGLFDQLRKRRPELSSKDCQLVAHALRQFFLAHLKSGRQYVSMPSQVADDLWHEFILFTRHYELFCRRAFGRFLHHTPAVAVGSDRKADAGLQRTWFWACKEDHIRPRAPTRLPLLFALDAKLGVAGGFTYVLDCQAARAARGDTGGVGVIHCGADMASACGGGSGDGSSDGGDGGSGCGGGGCGGGD